MTEEGQTYTFDDEKLAKFVADDGSVAIGRSAFGGGHLLESMPPSGRSTGRFP